MHASLSSLGIPTALLAGLLANTLSAQAGSYTIIDIGDLAPAGSHDGTNAAGINELGHVAALTGDGTGGYIPVLYRDGQLINLGGFPGENIGGGGKGVNNLDQVSGWSMSPYPSGGFQSEPFVWTEGEGMTNPINDEPTNWSGEAWDVNDAGQMVFTTKGGFFDPATGFKRINFGGVGGYWRTWDLNEDGVVSGSAFGPSGQINAFRYDSATDTITNLNDPVLDHHSDAYGLNDLGDIAGWALQFGPSQSGVVWTADGQTLRLPVGDLGVNQIQGTAEHINNHGDVVGLDSFPGPHAGNPDFEPLGWVTFQATEASPVVKTNLLSLVDPAAVAYWRRLHPFEINDRGEICGLGVAQAWIGDGSGGARGFLMVPNTPDRFRSLSRSLPGVNGHPVLVAKGTLEPGTAVEMGLYKAAPNASGFLMLGLDTVYAPLKGGVLVPAAFSAGGSILPTLTDGIGGVSLTSTWPAGIPANLDIVAQYWIADAAGAEG
ncbi:MAG: hypothetical protein DRQ55_13305 [Planctomycetota bacterium]|nr:MAG: hypothetical protein DRQ55_13305 [Planctomycetota bacterium]